MHLTLFVVAITVNHITHRPIIHSFIVRRCAWKTGKCQLNLSTVTMVKPRWMIKINPSSTYLHGLNLCCSLFRFILREWEWREWFSICLVCGKVCICVCVCIWGCWIWDVCRDCEEWHLNKFYCDAWPHRATLPNKRKPHERFKLFILFKYIFSIYIL